MEHGTGVSIFKINRLEMENSVIVRDSIEDILQDRYKNIRKLELMDKDENIRVFRQKTGDLCFIGEYKKTASWKNIFTGDVTDNIIRADYNLRNDYVKYVNHYVCEEATHEDTIICLKPNTVNDGADIYINVINKEYADVLRNSLKENDTLESDFGKLKAMRCIKLSMFNILSKKSTLDIREYQDGFTDSKIIVGIPFDEYENIVAYNNKSKHIICNDYKYYDRSNGDDVLLCSCYSEEKSRKADISGIVELLKPRGYIYVKPFIVEKDIKSAKIICVANRRIELEYYDDKDDKWKSFESLDNYEAGKKLQLRASVEYGDRIKNIVVAN